MHSIHLTHTDRRGADTVSTMRNRYLIIIFIAMLVSACSKDGGGHGTGGISFALKMPQKEASLLQYKATDIPCIEYGIVRVVAQVYDNQENLITTGGPWPCDTGEGTISGIEEGSGYSISLSLNDSEGNVVLQGSKGGIEVIAGQTTDAGLIQLTSSNNPPVFGSIADQQVSELQLVTFIISASDPDGNKVTYSSTNLPAGATLDPVTGSFYWTPAYDQGGNYTVTFLATDDGAPPKSASLNVNITVGNVNRPPVLTVPAGAQHVTRTGTLAFTVSATDPDGDSLTFDFAYPPWSPISYVNLPGVSFNASTQTFTWVAPGSYDYDAVGEHKVLFRVTDNGTPRMSDYEWVTIQVYDTITDINNRRFPVLTPIGSKQINPGQNLEFTVTASDPDGNTPTYTAAAIPDQDPMMNYIYGSDHIFQWVTNTQGNYWIRFIVRDTLDYYGYTHIDSVHEDVVITVGNVNRPPELTPIGRRSVRNNQPIEFIVTATDPENDTLTYSMSSASASTGLPAGVAFNAATQIFTWTPSLSVTPPASYTIRFSVSDDGSPSESDYEDVVITVLP